MIPATWEYAPVVLAIAFAVIVAGLIVNAVLKDRREFRRFTRLRSSIKRRRTMRKWVIQSFLTFGGAALVALLLAGQYVELLLDDINDFPFIVGARAAFDANHLLGTVIVVSFVVIIVAVSLFGIIAARNETDIPTIGDVQSLLPRNRAELKWGAALSINAGVVEELLFRLGIPALVFGFSGNAIVSVIASIVLFGMLHAYQGIAGIIGTTIIGAVFMGLYVATESIVAAIVVHALFDLRSLVLIPIVIKGVHRIVPQR